MIHTAAFKAHVLKRNCSPLCQWCGETSETVGHACKDKCWTCFKERILARLLWHISMTMRGAVSERVVDATRYVTRLRKMVEQQGNSWYKCADGKSSRDMQTGCRTLLARQECHSHFQSCLYMGTQCTGTWAGEVADLADQFEIPIPAKCGVGSTCCSGDFGSSG